MNTNIDGKTKIMFAMTAIKGVGRRYSNLVLKKADVDLTKRAGELSDEEVRHFIIHHYKFNCLNRLRQGYFDNKIKALFLCLVSKQPSWFEEIS